MKLLIDTTFVPFRPNKVVAYVDKAPEFRSTIPLIADKIAIEGKPTAYVCTNYVCKYPVTHAQALADQLDHHD